MKINPSKTSGRTKQQIVMSLENTLSKFIICEEHSLTCRCEKCIQAYLDKMLANSNALMSTEQEFDIGFKDTVQIERWHN